MEVWVIFESYSWCDADWHTEWNIYGIYNSEEKANEVIASLKAELTECEKDEIEYKVEKHSVQ